jgi:hypothetical protein
MIKKLTAYSFIILANIVLLAHAVFPHHHHEQQVCIERTHCASDAEAHGHNTDAKDHQHDGNANSTECVLKQAFVIPSSQAKFVNNCDNCSDNHNHHFFILSNFGYVDLQPDFEVVTYIPEFSSFLISFVTTSLGLRAPPLV